MDGEREEEVPLPSSTFRKMEKKTSYLSAELLALVGLVYKYFIDKLLKNQYCVEVIKINTI